jgi:hypothetical protein
VSKKLILFHNQHSYFDVEREYFNCKIYVFATGSDRTGNKQECNQLNSSNQDWC